MTTAQEQAWQALIQVSAATGHSGWCLVGGQMVHLHCHERGVRPNRPTDDGDAALDVRARPQALMEFTAVLKELGFEADGESWEGHQHRWIRGQAKIDVLIPRGLGERAASRRGATGGTTLQSPGLQQALDRVERVSVAIGEVTGIVPRPNLLGALVVKAAAHLVTNDSNRRRHIVDFAVLASLVSRGDRFREQLTVRDRRYLNGMIDVMERSRPDWVGLGGALQGMARLSAALGRNTPP